MAQLEGSLNIVIGCMFSGKTSELITVDKKWSAIGKTVLCINYAKDIRYGTDSNMYSHSLDKTKCVMVMKLEDVQIELITSADKRFAAASNEIRVRVESS